MVVAAMLAACTSGIHTPSLSTLVLVSGSGQSAPIGATLPQPLIVRVEDLDGQPRAGARIKWEVTAGGGSVTPTESVTDGSGEAVTSWRLGGSLGGGAVSAKLNTLTVVFSATATVGPPAVLVAESGNGQAGTVGTELAQPLVVKATDAVGNPTGGVLVNFSVVSAGGTLSAGSALTDAAGLASVRWTLSGTAGTQTMTARANGIAPLTLSASATAGAPSGIAIVAPGNNQNGPPGAPLADSIRVRVVDQFGNVVANASVSWTPYQGHGSVSPGSSTTDVNGRTATRWTLGNSGGSQYTVASIGGGAASVTFTAGGTVLYGSVSSGGSSSCGLTLAGAMLCWGQNADGQLGIGTPQGGGGPLFPLPQPSAAGNLSFRQVVVSLHHACAVTLTSIAHCWGLNFDGRLGTNSVLPENTPEPVAGAVLFQSVAVSRNHSCALALSERVYCWGFASNGQIGIGAVGQSILVPTEVSGGVHFQAVAAGGQHSCAIATGAGGGAGYCWGVNTSGQLGDGTTTTRYVPTPMAGGLTFAAIAAGYAHSCGLTSAGVAYCWGNNAEGQLGSGASALTPAPVSGGLLFASVTAGQAHSCARTAAGVLYCWGSNLKGQLGDGTTNNRSVPVLVSGGLVFRSVSAGDQHTCAVSLANLSYCWGDNQFGQLGDGTLVNRSAPTRVAFQP